MRINCEDILSLLVQSLAAETDWFLCLKEWMMIFVYTLSIEPVDWELEQNRTEQNVIYSEMCVASSVRKLRMLTILCVDCGIRMMT